MILVAVIVFLVIVGLLVAGLGVLANRKPEPPMTRLLRMHGEYMANAARASRKGHEGEANVWFEGAKNLWEHKERTDPTPAPKRVVARQLTGGDPVRYGDFKDRIPEHLLVRAEARRKQLEGS